MTKETSPKDRKLRHAEYYGMKQKEKLNELRLKVGNEEIS